MHLFLTWTGNLVEDWDENDEANRNWKEQHTKNRHKRKFDEENKSTAAEHFTLDLLVVPSSGTRSGKPETFQSGS